MDLFAPFDNTAPVAVTIAGSAQTDTAPLTVTVPNASQTDTAPLPVTVPNASQTDTAPLAVTVPNATQTNTAPLPQPNVGKIPVLYALTVATASVLGPDGDDALFTQTIDGVSIGEDQIVLCINEEDSHANGLWISGDPNSRPPDFDAVEDTRLGLIVQITGGTKAGKRYYLKTAPVDIGSDPIFFTEITTDPKSLGSTAFTNTAPVARTV